MMMEINHKEQQQEKITTEACLIHASLSLEWALTRIRAVGWSSTLREKRGVVL